MSDEPQLQFGSQGEWVTHLQQILVSRGFLHEAPDGAFGRHTHDAVCHFQHNAQLTVDGIVGPHTWRELGSGAVSDNPLVGAVAAGLDGAAHVVEATADALGAHAVAAQVHATTAAVEQHAAKVSHDEHARMSAPARLDIPKETYERIRSDLIAEAHARLDRQYSAQVEAVNDFTAQALPQASHLKGNPPSQFGGFLKSLVDVVVTAATAAAGPQAKILGSLIKVFTTSAADYLQNQANASAAQHLDAAKKHLENDINRIRAVNEQAAQAGRAAAMGQVDVYVDGILEAHPDLITSENEHKMQLADLIILDPAQHSPKAQFIRALEVTWQDIYARAQSDLEHNVDKLTADEQRLDKDIAEYKEHGHMTDAGEQFPLETPYTAYQRVLQERQMDENDLVRAAMARGQAGTHAVQHAEHVNYEDPNWAAEVTEAQQ